MLEASLAAGVAAAGGHALLGGVLPDARRRGAGRAATGSTWRRWCRPRTTPTRTTGSSSSGPRARSWPTTTRRGSRRLRATSAARTPGRPGARAPRRRRGLRARARVAVQRPRPLRAPHPARLRARRHLPGGARDLPPPRRGPRGDGGEPDGRNINAGCGSTHVSGWASRGPPGGHDVGFAFDGDGIRVLAVDRNGWWWTVTS